jgi:outer membrane protein OmpA-like peptidoglycan-associated protein
MEQDSNSFIESNSQSSELIDRLVNLLVEVDVTESVTDNLEILATMFVDAEVSSNKEAIKTVELPVTDDRELTIEVVEELLAETIIEPEVLSIEEDDRSLAEGQIKFSPEIPKQEIKEEQKNDRSTTEKNKIDDSEKILETANAVNALIPLMVELLNSKIDFSKDAILEAVAPEIDRLIEQRTAEDAQKMGTALAPILPKAIGIEILSSPQQIAKAIAPEVALAIQEQIRLDRNSISRALGSEMGKAIKNQIELERDAMVDALYPVIGDTVSKYMVDVVKNINEKVEQALTPKGIERKIRAKLQGVSEAELILQEAIQYEVQAIFLIHKASGAIVEEVQSPQLKQKLESDLLAGMLTAIRSFVNDCISLDRTSELNEIEYGDAKIMLEVGGYCYLAAIVKGEPSKQFIANLRETLSQIILVHGETIENYDGDPRTIPSSIQTALSQLLENKTISAKKKKPLALLVLLGIILLAIGIPWGISLHRQSITSQIDRELYATPELSVYRLNSTIKGGKLILTGRVGSDYLKTQAETIVAKIAKREKLIVENQIVAAEVPIDPTLVGAEIQRTTDIINQREGVAIVADYQPKKLTIRGVVIDDRGLAEITQAFQAIPSIDTIVVQTSPKLPQINQRIYFPSNNTEIDLGKITQILREIASTLQDNPRLQLRIIGHADISGETEKNRQLKEKRAANIKLALADLGIEADRLHAIASSQPPPAVSGQNSLALSRCVRFELFIRNKTEQ